MLKHTPSAVAVFQSDDYKRFILINGNRGLNQKKIDKIIAEITAGNDMLQYYPIQVRVIGDKLQILDGQHRFFICKKLKRVVHYILVLEEKNIHDIAKINSNVEKWKPQDFLNCYINLKNPDYIKLQEFISKYRINISVGLNLLDHGHPGIGGDNKMGDVPKDFENGTFKVKAWKEAVVLVEKCKQFEPFENWTDRSFILAIHKLTKEGLVPLEDIVAASHRNAGMLTKQVSHKQYLLNLEAIINKNKQKRIVII